MDSVSNHNNLILDSTNTSQKTQQNQNASSQFDKESKLSEEDQKKIDELKTREQEVIAHEQSHRMAGGSLVRGAIEYEYETGPDGNRYIIGGEVDIDTSPVDGDPEATITKMQLVIRAALAPANPSEQDRRVAQEARSQEAKARIELMQQRLSGEVETTNLLDSGEIMPSQYNQNGDGQNSNVNESRVDILG